ncbi:hypothetical protein ADK75_03755 [Streptomyces virginiae]|uniref:Uncharacterized protein n=1 Tax=Streptomyces virginiae TaxID=1961 RepID=A0A0L8N4K1_STRVG|nr:hypothetical protein ADK75_03755 [Streptomyces virginiae]
MVGEPAGRAAWGEVGGGRRVERLRAVTGRYVMPRTYLVFTSVAVKSRQIRFGVFGVARSARVVRRRRRRRTPSSPMVHMIHATRLWLTAGPSSSWSSTVVPGAR